MVASRELGQRRIPFEPALDGLRGLALLGMLCFHSEFAWAVGGFLPIPTFFTLSGYLITSLFLVEWEQNGRIRLGAFWARRFRRLMPAALLTLGAMSLFGVLVATPDQVARLRDGVVWALFYAANWHFMLSDIAYAQLFEAQSPVQHFWSLAIEEQFYFLFPLITIAGLWLGSGSRAVFGGVLAMLTVGSVLASVWLTTSGASADRVYYGSDTRAAELLMGGVLATLLCGRELSSASLRRLVQGLGAIAMVVMVGLWTTVDLGARWLYLGGFAAYTVLSAAVIAAGVQPSGPVRALLSGRLIRWIGRVSYGAYLFHWPVYLWLSEERTGLASASLFALRVGVTFVLAGLSYRFLESPIRSGRALTGWRPLVVTPIAFAVVFLAVSAVTSGLGRDGSSNLPGDANVAELQRFVEKIQHLEKIQGELPNSTEAPSLFKELPRVAFFGDSTAIPLGVGLGFWLEKRKRGRFAMGIAELGCGMIQEGRYRFAGKEFGRPDHCTDRDVSWAEAIARHRPDVVVVLAAPWDVCDRKLPGHDTWQHPGDPALDEYLQRKMLSAVDLLASDGALLLWLTHPPIEVRELGGNKPEQPFPASDPRRMARLNELVFEIERLRAGQVRVIDLATYMSSLPGGELDPNYRPDGTHLSFEGALKLANDWLGREVLRIYREEAERQGEGASGGRHPPSR